MSGAGRFPLGAMTVDRLGFGALPLGFQPEEEYRSTGIGLLREARELGIDHIDTASFYGDGVANDLIRRALHPYPPELAIVSKVGFARTPDGRVDIADSPARLRRDIEENLRQLGAVQLAAVNLRMPDPTAEPDALFDDQLATMIAAREEGLIAGIGLSNISVAQLRHALTLTDIVEVQNPLNLGDASSAGLLDETRRHKIAFVPYSPLGWPRSGRAAMTDRDVVQREARRLGATAEQVLLAWVLSLGLHVLLIAGTTSSRHLHENLAVAEFRLDEEARGELDRIWRSSHRGATSG